MTSTTTYLEELIETTSPKILTEIRNNTFRRYKNILFESSVLGHPQGDFERHHILETANGGSTNFSNNLTKGVRMIVTTTLESLSRIHTRFGALHLSGSVIIKWHWRSTNEDNCIVKTYLDQTDNTGIGFKLTDYDLSKFLITYHNSSEEVTVDSDNWNIDKLDGSGPSSFNLDFSARCEHIWWVFLKLDGAGDMLYGVEYNGMMIPVHANTNNTTGDLKRKYQLVMSLESNGTANEILYHNVSIHYDREYNDLVGEFLFTRNYEGSKTILASTADAIFTIRPRNSLETFSTSIVPITLNIDASLNEKFYLRVYYANQQGVFTVSGTDVNVSALTIRTSITSFSAGSSNLIKMIIINGFVNLDLTSFLKWFYFGYGDTTFTSADTTEIAFEIENLNPSMTQTFTFNLEWRQE